MCAWCNSEEILSGCPVFFWFCFFWFFFTRGFLKSLDAFTDGNKDKLGLFVFLVVSLGCHLATPDNLHQRMLPFRRTCSLFLCSLPLFCYILCEWQMLHWLCLYIHVCACVHSGTHNTSLTAGPSLQALGCLLLTLHICLSSSLSLSLLCFIFCFLIFLGCLKKNIHSFSLHLHANSSSLSCLAYWAILLAPVGH